MTPINLAAKLSTFTSHWSPRIVGSRNGKDLKVVQVRDGFVGHDHPDTDAAFMMRAVFPSAKFLRRNLQNSSKSFGPDLT